MCCAFFTNYSIFKLLILCKNKWVCIVGVSKFRYYLHKDYLFKYYLHKDYLFKYYLYKDYLFKYYLQKDYLFKCYLQKYYLFKYYSHRTLKPFNFRTGYKIE